MKRSGLTALLALLLAAALVYGVAQLFSLRLEHGDVYPPYSTLRADPLGAKALYEALDELPGYDTRRNFRPLVRLRPAKPVTLIYAGIARRSVWGEEEFREFQNLVASGTRVVFAFTPEEPVEMKNEPPKPAEKTDAIPLEEKKDPAPIAEEKKKDDSEKKPDSEKEKEEEKTHALKFEEVAERLGFRFQRFTAKDGKIDHLPAIRAEAAPSLDPQFSWHSAAWFSDLKPAWRTLYTCDGKPVIVERDFGSGSIVLASDSYFLSNEALRRERSALLLAYLAGPPREIIFDEEHHGIVENANIATLARKYRLHGLLAGALLAVALFIWQSSAPFLPPAASRRPDLGVVTGKSADEGFINLIRRALTPKELLAACAAEWRKAFDPDGKSDKAAHLERVLATDRNPVTAYQTISTVLSQKK